MTPLVGRGGPSIGRGCTHVHPIILEDALVASKGLGEDMTNGAATRPVIATREGRAREERVKREGELERAKEMSSEPEP